MVDINLLPWRDKLLKVKVLRVACILTGILGSLLCLALWLWYRSDQNLQTHLQRNHQLQQEVIDLQVENRRQLLALSKPNIIAEPAPIRLRKQKEHLATSILPIHYAKAADLAMIMKDKSNALLSRHGHIAVDQRTNVLWIEDTAAYIDKLHKFVRSFDKPAQQIIIEARLVNMNEETARDLGVRLGLIAPSNTGSSDNKAAPISGGRLGMDMAARTLESTAATLGFTQALLLSQRLLDIELSALESQGKAKVIASPRLITSNQIAALIESGEDIPYQEFSMNGNTSVAFKKAVLRLQVVPQITAKQELMMSLVINQDADSGKRVQGVPIIATKSIETHILVRHGQTIVLGGIYQEDHNRQVDQIPILGDIPWIGDFFQRQHMRVRHETLLIFITPRILNR